MTDHAPHTQEEKADFEKAPNGIVGLETSLAATLTALYHTGKCSLQDVVRMMAVKPREILGLAQATLAEGADANLILVDTEKKWTVEPEKLHGKSCNTAFRGTQLTGKTVMTITDGIIRFEEENPRW